MTEGTTTTTTGAEAPAGGAVQSTTTDAGGNAAWYSSFQNPDLRGYAERKGWSGPEAMLESYRNLEKLNGREKIVIPKDESDAEAWNAAYDRLGRPKAAADYGIQVAEGKDATRINMVTEVFHQLGLNTRQARGVVDAVAKFEAEQAAQEAAAFANQTNQDMVTLRNEWGSNYDTYAAAGQRAVHQLGISEEQLGKLERALGTKDLMTMMANIGLNFAEDTFEGGESPNQFNSVEAAKAQKAALMDDKDWVQRYNNGDAVAREQMRKLNETILHYEGGA